MFAQMVNTKAGNQIQSNWLVKAVVALILASTLFGCNTGRQATQISNTRHPYQTIPLEKTTYLIKPGDKLKIKNLNWISDLAPEPGVVQGNTGGGISVNVNSTGHIGLPDIGPLKVSGISREQLSDTLAKRYNDILKNPIFEVEVISLKVKVLGAVEQQGLIPIENEHQSLGEILAKAGGIKFLEAGHSIQIIRGEGIDRRVITYDFEQLGDPNIINQHVYDDDLIYVPTSRNAIRSANYQRNLVVIQPVLALLNFAVLVINLVQLTK